MNKKNHRQRGFVAFTTLLVISAVTLSIAMSVALLGVNEAKSSLDAKKAVETIAVAEACTEETLYRLKLNANYAGGSLIVGDGQCTINVTGGAEDKTIVATATIGTSPSYTKIITATARRRGGGVIVRTWAQTP